jgi:hypothetical protein
VGKVAEINCEQVVEMWKSQPEQAETVRQNYWNDPVEAALVKVLSGMMLRFC